MRVALVGLGDIGLNGHLPALRRHPAIELTHLADHSQDRRGLVGTTTAVVESLDKVLVAGVDGVVLATPPWATPYLAVRAAKAGAFVLAEKPVATSAETARVYSELTHVERTRIQVGLTYRHHPAMQALAGWTKDGTLGRHLLVRAHIYDEQRRPDDPEHTQRILATLERGTPVIHEGAHVLDWLRYLLGSEPESITNAWSVRTADDLPASNLIGATLRYPNGNVALVEFGWLTDALPRCELSIIGDRGHAVLDCDTFSLTLNGDRTTFDGDKMTRCFDLQLDRFVALFNGADPSPSLADGLAALESAERIAEGAR